MGRPPPTRPAIFTSSYITVCLPLWYTSDRLFFRAIISLCFTAPGLRIYIVQHHLPELSWDMSKRIGDEYSSEKGYCQEL
jgi:hypothetical protein